MSIPLSPLKKPYRILMLVHADWEYGREIILGARHHAFTTGRMEVGNIRLNDDISLVDVVRQQKIDGIIAAAQDATLEAKLAALPIPVVNVSNVLNQPRLPLVTPEDRAVGRLAASHLLGCGCTTLAYWGQSDARFSKLRIEGFLDEIARRNPNIRCIAGEGRSLVEDEGEVLLGQMKGWVKELPAQTGVFAVLDLFALHLLQAAREVGKVVPQDLAIIGTGDDSFWVDFERIPLSSVKLPAWRIGLEAATLLDELISEKVSPAALRKKRRTAGTVVSRYLPVTEVTARLSSDVFFIEDKAVAKAIAYIREHAAQNIYVPDVVQASGVSRSGLQQRFARTLKRSILEEIRTARIDRVKALLRTTDMKMTEIAEACDFPNSSRLHVLFRQYTGQTPSQYRKVFQRR